MDFRNPSLCATPSIGQPLLIPAVRTVRGCDNPLEIGAIALGRIPCSGPRREKSGEGGEERPSIIISALLDARMYVHSRAPYLWTWLEGAGRACTAPQPSGAHLLVRRSAARYLQRRANSWRGLLASLVTTVFSSWSTSIDLWSIVNARLIERAWVARPCTLALPACLPPCLPPCFPACLPAFHPTTRIYLFSLFFIPLLLAPSFLAFHPSFSLLAFIRRPSPIIGVRDTGFIGFPFSSFHSFASFSRWPMFRFDQWVLLLSGERLWRGRGKGREIVEGGNFDGGRGRVERIESFFRFWWRNWISVLRKKEIWANLGWSYFHFSLQFNELFVIYIVVQRLFSYFEIILKLCLA